MEIAYGFCIFFSVVGFMVAGICVWSLTLQSTSDKGEKDLMNPSTPIEKNKHIEKNQQPVEIIALQAKLKSLEARVPEMTPNQVKDVDFMISSL